MKIYFKSSQSFRNWTSNDISLFMSVLNDPRAWPFSWTRTFDEGQSNWTVRLEDRNQIAEETGDLDVNNEIEGLSVTFMRRKPRETLFSAENWTSVPGPLRPFKYSKEEYRTYLILHECGHALGLGHARCSGGQAPIMLQQTKGLNSGQQMCTKNIWPLAREIKGFE